MSQSCIPAFSLQFMCITFLCMQSDSDYSVQVQLVFILSKSSVSIYIQYKFSQYLYSVQVQPVFILSTSSDIIYQYRYFFNSVSVILSSLLLVELCSSPCTLHHSRFQRGSTRGGAQQQWSLVWVRGAAQDQRCLGVCQFYSVLSVQDQLIFQLRDFPLNRVYGFQFILDSQFLFQLIEMFNFD